MKGIDELLNQAKTDAFDLQFSLAKKWKGESPERVLIGYLPIYFPREIIHASNGLAVGIMGSGDRLQIVKGDAYYQSYICHMPRGVIELALNGHLDNFDGFVFPSICDVIRNLSGMFQLIKKGRFNKYLDFPQNFDSSTGGVFYRNELQIVLDEVYKINGIKATKDQLNNSIKLYNKERELLEKIYDIRQEFPWRLSAEDLYYFMRSGLCKPIELQLKVLEQVYQYICEDIGEPKDQIKVVVSGAFCEQPPIGLIKTIEMAGCYVVDDDFMLGSRWIQGPVEENTNDPLGAIVSAYLMKSPFSSTVYDANNPKGDRLVKLVRKRKADGVIFAAASFCDPALLDRPTLVKACEDAGIRQTGFQYHENIGQFKVIKEQVGAFSDSIKLWEEEVIK